MSCDFDIRCRTHSVDAGFHDRNHAHDEMAWGVAYREMLADIGLALKSDNAWMWRDSDRLAQLALFMHEHQTCDVCVWDEYGYAWENGARVEKAS